MIIHPNKTYLMERMVKNRDYPLPTKVFNEIIMPYHDMYYISYDPEFAQENKFQTIDELVNFLKPLSGKQKIVNEKHPDMPEEVDIDGNVEKNGKIRWDDAIKIKRQGIDVE